LGLILMMYNVRQLVEHAVATAALKRFGVSRLLAAATRTALCWSMNPAAKPLPARRVGWTINPAVPYVHHLRHPRVMEPWETVPQRGPRLRRLPRLGDRRADTSQQL
jgi:hypothetical protein